jgi:alpha-tubulin suppressor-like RCC1 family protein
MPARSVRAIAVLLASLSLASCNETHAPESAQGPAPGAPALATAAFPSFMQVSGGDEHTCGVSSANRVLCWGSGQLGNGPDSSYRSPPVEVAGGHSFRQVSAGLFHTCAITSDFRAFCWGYNGAGQLGDGTTTYRATPVAVAGGQQFRGITVGDLHTCAVGHTDNKAYCWGDNTYSDGGGQLGDGTNTNRATPTPVIGNLSFRQVTAGLFHTCGVTMADQVYCWGSDRYGQIGDNPARTPNQSPAAVAGGLLFRELDAGAYHTCAVTRENRAYCWGYNVTGAIGDGTTLTRFTPRAVNTSLFFRRLTGGLGHTCGETPNNKAHCWGSNFYGELGDGTTRQRLTPVAVAGGLSFVQVGAGSIHTCARTADGAGYCWGRNLDAQLGDGTIRDRTRPVRVQS